MLALLQDIFRANTELTESSPNITVSLSKQVAGRAVLICFHQFGQLQFLRRKSTVKLRKHS